MASIRCGSMPEPDQRTAQRPRRHIDQPRLIAFDALRAINSGGGYANLVTAEMTHGLQHRDAGFVIELVHGTCRMQGSYDRIIEHASGRPLSDLQAAVLEVLRLACHQLFRMRVPTHAAVASSVDLAGVAISERVTGLVNAIVRKLSRKDFDEWCDEIGAGFGDLADMALRFAHPRWIVDALADALQSDDDELAALLDADNEPPIPMLVVRPGLARRPELMTEGARRTPWSPWGVERPGNPSELPAIRQGRAGVQDEGSQLVVQAATAVTPRLKGPWLDLCAGPGGKSALLRGLCPSVLIAAEPQPHRAELVAHALRAYPGGYQVVVADGRHPAWAPASMALTLADVPCTGLGALRRRPESRWRRDQSQVAELAELQRELLDQAIASTMPGGLVAYVTCSPHRAETIDVVAGAQGVEILDAPSMIPEVPEAASRLDDRFIQLWPHIHGTDAMFCALLCRT